MKFTSGMTFRERWNWRIAEMTLLLHRFTEVVKARKLELIKERSNEA